MTVLGNGLCYVVEILNLHYKDQNFDELFEESLMDISRRAEYAFKRGNLSKEEKDKFLDEYLKLGEVISVPKLRETYNSGLKRTFEEYLEGKPERLHNTVKEVSNSMVEVFDDARSAAKKKK